MPCLRGAAVVCAGLVAGLYFGISASFGLFLKPISDDLGLQRETLSLAVAVGLLLNGEGSDEREEKRREEKRREQRATPHTHTYTHTHARRGRDGRAQVHMCTPPHLHTHIMYTNRIMPSPLVPLTVVHL